MKSPTEVLGIWEREMTWRETRGCVGRGGCACHPWYAGMCLSLSPPSVAGARAQGRLAAGIALRRAAAGAKGRPAGGSLVVAFLSRPFIYSFVVLLPPSCHLEGLFRKSPGSALQTAARELFRGYRVAPTSLTAVIKGCCGLVSGSISFLNSLLSM